MQKNMDYRIVLLEIMADGSLKMTINENHDWPADILEEICQEYPDEGSALTDLLEKSGYHENGYGYRYGYEAINPAALAIQADTPIIGQFDLSDDYPRSPAQYARFWQYNALLRDPQSADDFMSVLLADGEVIFSGVVCTHGHYVTPPPTKSRLYQMAKKLHALIAAGNVDRDTAQEIADMVGAMKSQATPTSTTA